MSEVELPETTGSETQPNASTLSDSERASHYIEIWKQATQVNQHFNDIEWRIRGLALTVATFSIGAAGLAARDGDTVGGVSVGTLLVGVGIVLWLGFYFVDVAWYHQLLRASAKQTGRIEDQLIALGLSEAGLGKAISEGSPIRPPWWVALLRRSKDELHSTHKLRVFYWGGAFALALVAGGFQAHSMQTDPPAEPTPHVTVNLDRGGTR